MRKNKNNLRKTFNELKSLKIQGASNVRKAIIKALEKTVIESTAVRVNEFRRELKSAALYLLSARPTEPEARNAVRIIFHQLNSIKNLKELKKEIIKECREFELNRKKALKKIAFNGLKLFKKKKTVFTHCHSHTVEEIIKLAKKKGKIKKVIATETRPKMQGHITVKNLTKAGVKCTLIVDSAVSSFIEEADLVLVGSDAIQFNGSIVNKIGTKTVALTAKKEGKPVYSCASYLKFDPETMIGKPEKIEERSFKEVWMKKIKNLEIKNPAFDVTPDSLITGIVSELGILKPKTFVRKAKEKIKKEFS